jgi:hypothetical protein
LVITLSSAKIMTTQGALQRPIFRRQAWVLTALTSY